MENETNVDIGPKPDNEGSETCCGWPVDADEAKNQADAAYFKPEAKTESSDPTSAATAASPSQSASSEAVCAVTPAALPFVSVSLLSELYGKTTIVKGGDELLRQSTIPVLKELRDAYDAANLPVAVATTARMPQDSPSVPPVATLPVALPGIPPPAIMRAKRL